MCHDPRGTLTASGCDAPLCAVPAGKVSKGEMIRIIISKDLFAGCDGAMAVAYAALQAAARSWAGEELVHQART